MKQTLCLIFSKIKIEFFLKGSLDLIPSPLPSVKTQILGRELCLRCKGKTLKYKKFVDITRQCFASIRQVNFPSNNLNFHWRWRWWDLIQAIFFNLLYFNESRPFTLHCGLMLHHPQEKKVSWRAHKYTNINNSIDCFQIPMAKRSSNELRLNHEVDTFTCEFMTTIRSRFLKDVTYMIQLLV